MSNEQKLTGRGGAGRGQGRKDEAEKKSISVSLDITLIECFDSFGPANRSGMINQILNEYKTKATK